MIRFLIFILFSWISNQTVKTSIIAINGKENKEIILLKDIEIMGNMCILVLFFLLSKYFSVT